MGGHLRECFDLSKKFSAIARTPVKVYMNNRTKRYELHYRGNHILGMLDYGLDAGAGIVEKHFRKVRSNWSMKNLKRFQISDTEERERFEKDLNEYAEYSQKEIERASREPITFS